MANSYYDHIAVGSPQEASIFSNEYTWTILDVLRKAGSKGLTAKEVHDRVQREMGSSVSSSKVYSLLKRLYQEEWIHRYYDPTVQAQRNAIGLIWGGIIVDDNFYEAVKSKTLLYAKSRLFPVLFEYILKTMEEFKSDEKTKKWLPGSGHAENCKRCHSSHEAEEFFSSLLDSITSEFQESEEFQKFMRKNKFIEDIKEDEDAS